MDYRFKDMTRRELIELADSGQPVVHIELSGIQIKWEDKSHQENVIMHYIDSIVIGLSEAGYGTVTVAANPCLVETKANCSGRCRQA